MKKTLLVLFGLVLAFALAAPPKASAQVAIGIGVGPYGYVAPGIRIVVPVSTNFGVRCFPLKISLDRSSSIADDKCRG